MKIKKWIFEGADMETYLTVAELTENAVRFRLSEIEARIDDNNDLKKLDEPRKENSSYSEIFCV